MRRIALLLVLAAASACQTADVRSIIYYNFALLDESAADEHYQQFADSNGGVIDVGCFVVQKRQLDCFDGTATGQPNLRLGVVECTCPCTESEPDPCDPTRRPVRVGTIRGLVNETQGPLQLGGVEIPTNIDLAHATDLFITLEKNADDSPSPSTNEVLNGTLGIDGTVLRGNLSSPSNRPVQGSVTILPVKDDVQL